MTTPPEFEPLSPGDPVSLGPFEVLARIGSGGMGMVYLGRDGDLLVAIKRVREEYAQQREFRARLAREVEAMGRVRGPFLARLVAADVQGTPQWLAMEYVPGPTLADNISGSGPLPERQVRSLALGLAEGLRAIHDNGVIHRDLKPSNIILTDRGPYVVDFGIATAADATSLTSTGQVIGSMGWMAPEQIDGRASVSPATDVFAWGAVTFFAATGRNAFGEGHSSAVAWRIVNGEPDFDGWPDSLADLGPLVRAALSRDPGERPTLPDLLSALTRGAHTPLEETSAAVLQSWDSAALGLGVAPAIPANPLRDAAAVAPTPFAAEVPRTSRSRSLLLGVSAAVVVASVAAAGLMVANSGGAGGSQAEPSPGGGGTLAATSAATVPAAESQPSAPGSDPQSTVEIAEGISWWTSGSGAQGMLVMCRAGSEVGVIFNPRYATDAGLFMSGSVDPASGVATLTGNAAPPGVRDASTTVRADIERVGTDELVIRDGGGYPLQSALGASTSITAPWRPATDDEAVESITTISAAEARQVVEEGSCRGLVDSSPTPADEVQGIPQGVAYWASETGDVLVTERQGDSLLTARQGGMGGLGCFKGVITGDSVEGAYSYTTAAGRTAGYAPPRMISGGTGTLQLVSDPPSSGDLVYTKLSQEQAQNNAFALDDMLAKCAEDMS